MTRKTGLFMREVHQGKLAKGLPSSRVICPCRTFGCCKKAKIATIAAHSDIGLPFPGLPMAANSFESRYVICVYGAICPIATLVGYSQVGASVYQPVSIAVIDKSSSWRVDDESMKKDNGMLLSFAPVVRPCVPVSVGKVRVPPTSQHARRVNSIDERNFALSEENKGDTITMHLGRSFPECHGAGPFARLPPSFGFRSIPSSRVVG